MNRKTLLALLAMLAIVLSAFATPPIAGTVTSPPGASYIWDEALKAWVADEGATVDVGTLTFDATPPFTKAGVATAAALNSDGILRVELASSNSSISAVVTSGTVDIQHALPAGTNNIGDVDVLTLPAIPAGTNTIGSVTVLNSLPLQYWGVGAFTSYQAALSTSTATVLSTLASFTANTYVEIQANAKIHLSSVGVATSTMQSCMYLAAGEVKGWRVGTSTFNLQVVADTAAIASFDMKIYPLY